MPSGADALARWTQLTPNHGFVPDPFAPSLSDQGMLHAANEAECNTKLREREIERERERERERE